MKYEEALARWGARKLEESWSYVNGRDGAPIDVDSVTVHFNFNRGYACCGGSDPDCYCSYAESPSAEVVITGCNKKGKDFFHHIDLEDFDFSETLKEIFDVADGNTAS